MIKLLFTGLIVFFIYRFFIAPLTIDKTGQEQEIPSQGNQEEYEDGEYIDYEEID